MPPERRRPRCARVASRRIHVIGNGTSYHSALAAATLYRRHAGPDDPIVVPLTAGEFRTYPPALGPGDAVLGISASGEFRDVVGVVETLRGRVPTVAVVHVPGSTLDRLADHVVRSAGGPSQVPVMTKTFVATLVATELVLAELLGGERAEAIRRAIGLAADHAEAAIDAARPLVPDLAESLAGAGHLFVVGSGAAWPAALEAALKLKEMAIVHAEGTESWEMASGVGHDRRRRLGGDRPRCRTAPAGRPPWTSRPMRPAGAPGSSRSPHARRSRAPACCRSRRPPPRTSRR